MVVISTVIFVFVVELLYYTLLIPDLSQKPLKVCRLERHCGRAAYVQAYLLSLLRAPLGLLPYLTKLFIFFVLKISYESPQSTYLREVVNMIGDFVNLGLAVAFILPIVGPPTLRLPAVLLYIPIAAEWVRLITERVPILFSATWQLLPHTSIAQALHSRQQAHFLWRWVAHCFARYCRYYTLSPEDRADYVLRALKQRAMHDTDLARRLEYIQAFRIIPTQYGLRSGNVRDVARGEVFIHAYWTNDPWLLVGMAIRRAPWMFDPRYLRRPFYYMTEANRLATLAVLEHARYSPPYAVFQFGHEIRVARLHLFYSVLRWFGADVEKKVYADGTFQFDQFIFWLVRKLAHGNTESEQRLLYTDEEVIADMQQRHVLHTTIKTLDIATRYTYPVKYVEEVLLDKINVAQAQRDDWIWGRHEEMPLLCKGMVVY
jgi:hypothetical protein